MKKPSAASDSAKLLEGFTFLVEESLGKGVAEKLRENGFTVVAQGDATENSPLPTGLKDPELFPLLGQKGYILLSKDLRTRYRPVEKAAIVAAKLGVFQLSRGVWTGAEMADAFIKAKPKMARLLRWKERPFIARLNREGKITAFYDKDRLTDQPDRRR